MEKEKRTPYIAVDLDGTLATYDHWRGTTHIGDPIKPMVNRVKSWIAKGFTVKIFTARVADIERELVIESIEKWCKEHIGVVLEVTNIKDYDMIVLFDDRAVGLYGNTGEVIGGRDIEDTVEARIERHY